MSLLPTVPHIDDALVVGAIRDAEQRTSGEIRVVISRQNVPDPLVAARTQFERLGLTATAARNAVLIFVAPRSHTFAVIGDRGIDEKCGPDFWSSLAAAMTDRFKAGDFTAALVLGIDRAGALLSAHFPRVPGDRNELPDEPHHVK